MLHFCFSAPGIPPGLLDRSLFLSTLLLYAVRLFRQFSNPPNLGPFSGEICVNLYVYSILYVYIQVLCSSSLYIFPYFFKIIRTKAAPASTDAAGLPLCFRGKRAARRVPRRTEQFFLSFGEFFQGDLPAQGSGSIRAALKVRKPQRPLCPGVLGPLAALVGPEPGGGVIGPTRVELPARAPHHIDERGLWPGCRLRRGHCFSAPDGRRQGPSPYPWP